MKGYFRKRGARWSFTLDIGRDEKTGKRKQKTVSGFSTKKEAQAAAADLIAKFEQGQYVEPSKVTVNEFLGDYMSVHYRSSVRPGTLERAEHMLKNHITPAFGHAMMKNLKPLHFQRFYAEKSEAGLSPGTIKGMHTFLVTAMEMAVTWELLPNNPARRAKPPKQQQHTISVWSHEESEMFLQHAKGVSSYYLIFLVALYTGMRKGEILGLRWDDIDFEAKTIYVNQSLTYSLKELRISEPKTKSSKRAILTPVHVLQELKKHRLRQKEIKLKLGTGYDNALAEKYVFTTSKGNFIYPQVLNKALVKLCKELELSPIRFHDLRHTHATMLLSLGVNPKIVSERLGHTSIVITLDTYSHVLPAMQEEMVTNLETAISKIQTVL
ncbi:tyrosine-type recombinase/integrase [Fictibacillus aquaticus]|nr:site-specific integrase [Fictibacillus aquaticus]